jgi:hypothetical protein
MRSSTPRLSYANVAATLALFIAVGGPATAAARALITGDDIRNGTVTSADIKDRSLRARDLGAGAARLRMVAARGPDIPAYENRDVIVQRRVPAPGHWLAITRFRAHNTGQSDDALNCAYRVHSQIYGAAGVSVTAGDTGTAESVGLVYAPQRRSRIQLLCEATNPAAFALSRITLKIVKIA